MRSSARCSSVVMPCTSDGSCGTRTRRVLRESPIDLVEVDHFLLVPRSQERIGAGFRQHAIDDHAADRHAGFLQLLDRARGLFDRQPLGDEDEHEGADPRAEQPGAELAQVSRGARPARSSPDRSRHPARCPASPAATSTARGSTLPSAPACESAAGCGRSARCRTRSGRSDRLRRESSRRCDRTAPSPRRRACSRPDRSAVCASFRMWWPNSALICSLTLAT